MYPVYIIILSQRITIFSDIPLMYSCIHTLSIRNIQKRIRFSDFHVVTFTTTDDKGKFLE